MKKKLGVLAALATVVTVGGVYATWSFAELDAPSANTTVNVAMTGTTGTSEKGTLSVAVMGEGGFTLAVDDADNNHYADLKKNGVITVTFTPSANASADVKQHGIDLNAVISYAAYAGGPASIDQWKFNDGNGEKIIFEITNDAANPIQLSKGQAVKDDSDNDGIYTFTWKIQPENVGIVLAGTTTTDTKDDDFYIDTKAKYDEMNATLAKGHFVITVSEA
ncbi:MAG: hypothetical protein IJX88_03445 [Clostridia bacterium]|nr:hypothetical protein [Clostridia bacterium]